MNEKLEKLNQEIAKTEARLFSGNKFYNFILIKMESVLDIYNSDAIMKVWKANFPSERRFA